MTQLGTGLRWGFGLLVAAGLLGTAGAARGQALSDLPDRAGEVQVAALSPTPRTFGTANLTAHVIGASEFDPMSGTASWGYLALVKSSSSQMVASVRLPSGALVHSVELEGCDSTGATGITVQLARRSSPGAVVTFVTPLGSTGGPATPSCGFLSVTPLPEFSPLVIDNENNTYTLLVQAPNINATVAAARVYYTLQVNPAPAVATFSDVPTSHPFFRSSRPSSPRGSRAAAAATTSARTPR